MADGICQQKVINELVIPLHKHWLQHPNADTVHTQWLSAAAHGRWGCSAQGWSTLMGLVCSCNPMLAGISKVGLTSCFCQRLRAALLAAAWSHQQCYTRGGG